MESMSVSEKVEEILQTLKLQEKLLQTQRLYIMMLELELKGKEKPCSATSTRERRYS
jgi:hypothetical protein